MCTNHWPSYLDMGRDECKRGLRSMELEAYSSLLSTFRAQGDLTKQKKDLLQELQRFLGISTERHRAEVRRAVNDEKLATIAVCLSGSDSQTEWQIEGRRLVPLLPRLVPQTSFTLTANDAANAQAEKNLQLVQPCQTASKEMPVPAPPPPAPVQTPKGARPSPSSDVVVLPSGMSIQVKGLTGEEDEICYKRRRRSSSSDSIIIGKTIPPPPLPNIGVSKVLSPVAGSPMKISYAKSPGRGINPGQKVLLVSSGQSGNTIYSRAINSSSMGKGNMIYSTVTGQTTPKASVVRASPSAHSYSATTGTYKPRTKTIMTTRPRTPQGSRQGVLVPISSQGQGMSSNIQIKQMSSKPTIHIKQEGGMKIITHGVPAGQRVPQGGRVLNITTPSGKLITAASPRTSNVVTVNPKTLQLTAIKGAPGSGGRVTSGTGAKPNVIVVQKAQPRKLSGPGGTTIQVKGTPLNSPYDKELVNLIQKQDGTKTAYQIKQSTVERKVIAPRMTIEPGRKLAVPIHQRIEGEASNKSLLAELFQEGSGEFIHTPGSSSGIVMKEEVVSTQPLTTVSSKSGERIITSSSAKVYRSNQWVEMDAPESHMAQSEQVITPTSRPTVKHTIIRQSRSHGKPTTTTIHPIRMKPTEVYTIEGATRKKVPETSASEVQIVEPEQVDSVMDEHGQIKQILRHGMQAVTSSGQIVQLQGLGQLQTLNSSGQQVLGELDPETGVFYTTEDVGEEGITQVVVASDSSSSNNQSTRTTVITTPQTQPDVVSTSGKDFLSSALSQADIHLDPYQFIEEDEPSVMSASNDNSRTASITAGRIVSRTNSDDSDDRPLVDMEDHSQNSKAGGDTKFQAQYASLEGLVSMECVTPTSSSTTLVAEEDASNQENQIVNQTVYQAVEVQQSQVAHQEQQLHIDQPANEVVETMLELATANHSVNGAGDGFQTDNPSKVALDNPASTQLEPSTVVTSTSTPSENYLESNRVDTEQPAERVVYQDYTNVESTRQTNQISSVDQEQVAQSTGEYNTQEEADLISKPAIIQNENHAGTETMLEISDQTNVVIHDHMDVRPTQDTVESNSALNVNQVSASTDQDTVMSDSKPQSIIEQSVSLDSHSTNSGNMKTAKQLPLVLPGDHALDVTHVDADESIGSPNAGSSSENDALTPHRASKRKRRPPVARDDTPPPQGHMGWIKAALGLLLKMSRFRGNKPNKQELNASWWFLRPVDPREVVDYYNIITNPMDFSTVKKKLEAHEYEDWEDFHSDMLLIRDNCHKYNPEGDIVRRDCDELFTYYFAEYDKTVDKWNKGIQTTSPSIKRLKIS